MNAGSGDKSARLKLAERAEWLADKIPAYGDYAKEAALHLRGYAIELRGAQPSHVATSDPFERPADWTTFDDWWNKTGADAHGLARYHAAREAWQFALKEGKRRATPSATQRTMPDGWSASISKRERETYDLLTPFGERVAQKDHSFPDILYELVDAMVKGGSPTIEKMVDRFLSWKLPEDFHPDAGISFSPHYNVEWNAKHGKPPERHQPIGTNLLTATQAKAMLLHVLGASDGKAKPK